mmetsp:Transcript_43819/g.101231  ORF Transcript_43819/g.101231 Transcript_43819/m.101231 type:complete len:1128 (-) Transcript_43819:129-3512(-)
MSHHGGFSQAAAAAVLGDATTSPPGPRCKSAAGRRPPSAACSRSATTLGSRPASAASKLGELQKTRSGGLHQRPHSSVPKFARIPEEPRHPKLDIEEFMPDCLYVRYGFSPPGRKEERSNGLLDEEDLLRNCHDSARAWMESMGFTTQYENGASPKGNKAPVVTFHNITHVKQEHSTKKLFRSRFLAGEEGLNYGSETRGSPGDVFKQMRQIVRGVARVGRTIGKNVIQASPTYDSILSEAKETIIGRKHWQLETYSRRGNFNQTPTSRKSPARSSFGARRTQVSFANLADRDSEGADEAWRASLRISTPTSQPQAALTPQHSPGTATENDEEALLSGFGSDDIGAAGSTPAGGKTLRKRLRWTGLRTSGGQSHDSLIHNSKFLNGSRHDTFHGDAERFQTAFERYTSFSMQELPREFVPEVVKHLGYCMLTEEAMLEVLDSVAPYSTIDPSEFMDFMQAYVRKEELAFEQLFHTFDLDGSGDIDKEELMRFMVSLGFTPLQDMVNEAMELADQDKNGTLDYDEMRLVVENYRRFEGFTRVEVAQMELIFDYFGNDDENLAVERLVEVLVEIFGAAHKDLAADLQAQAGKSIGLAGAAAHSKKKRDINFQEFLQWARRLREAEIESYRPLFAKWDADGSGSIEEEELKKLLKSMGLTPIKSVLDKTLALVDKDGNREISFEEFVNLMGILRRTEGFDDDELQGFENVFLRFDDDDSGEIDALEIVKVMRYLGFVVTLDDAHRLVSEVDANNSGAVDFREFLHLMRIHREEEIQSLQYLYAEHMDKGLGLLLCTTEHIFGEVLTHIDGQLDEVDQTQVIETVGMDKWVNGMPYGNFERFLAIADKTRGLCTERHAKYAGLGKEQILRFHELFLSYCHAGTEEISAQDLSDLLQKLGCPIRSKEEQAQVVRKLGEAREAAKHAGVPTDKLGSCKSKVSWFVFLQLAGWLTDEENLKRFSYELEVLEETDFTSGQVMRFHGVFEQWAKLEFVRHSSALPKAQRNVTQFTAPVPSQPADSEESHARKEWHRVVVAQRVQLGGPTVTLGLDGIVLGMTHDFNIHLKPQERQELGKKMIDVVARRGDQADLLELPDAEEKIKMDFPCFLYILRWMLNRNFAGINDVLLMRQGY